MQSILEGQSFWTGRKPTGDPGAGGFFFPVASDPKEGKSKKKDPADAIIKRTFLLSHTGYPDIPARKIVQFQYLEWPDMDVHRGVLNLIRQVDQETILFMTGVTQYRKPQRPRCSFCARRDTTTEERCVCELLIAMQGALG
ncbi:hypothetical protein GYMLUDRAFT_35160 [Collybiopsis luxurians FD-317 M1]|nr:hypothetical protein GYMLUDRAFT_35160 [Collybiopsis luxurians FD-317 M1]